MVKSINGGIREGLERNNENGKVLEIRCKTIGGKRHIG